MRTAIGLLACTGMRIGEALALDDSDLDIETG
jgi:integrase